MPAVRPLPGSPSRAPATVAATIGREIMIWGTLTRSRPTTVPQTRSITSWIPVTEFPGEEWVWPSARPGPQLRLRDRSIAAVAPLPARTGRDNAAAAGAPAADAIPRY